MFEIGAVYGWRRGELLGMRVRQVDFEARTIQLEAGTTKNEQPRLVLMTDDVIDLLKECAAGKGGDEYVFTRPARTGAIYREAGSKFWWLSFWHEGRQIHRSTRTESEEEARSVLRDQMQNCLQRPVCDFRKDWRKACVAAGCPGLLFHDLRRSAVRRMINCGVRETTAMRITGHRTRSVFDRYAISNEADLHEAVEKLERKPAEGINPIKVLERKIR
jgi:integrase